MIATRWSQPGDVPALARIHGEAWRFAYTGVLPRLAVERRVAAHGPPWWRRFHAAGGSALLVELEGVPQGYALLGPARGRNRGRWGEIYELYLDPVAHGAGLGRALFAAARAALATRGHEGLVVFLLEANELGTRFYEAEGGHRGGTAMTEVEGVPLPQIAWLWP